MTDHERIEELMAVRALGGLDGDDDRALRAEMSAHGPDCVECRRIEAEFDEVAGRLAFALDPAPVREGLEEEVVAATGTSVEPRPERLGGRAGVRWRLRPLVAVAASIVIFVGGLAIGGLVTGGDVPDDARVVAFEGEGAGTLSLAYRPDGDGVYLVGSGLDAPPEGRVYEVWMFQDGTPVPAACFSPTSDGSVFEFVDAGLGATEAMAVTVESSACPSAPTTEPILTAEITA
jgi:hypothetical protein